MYGKIRVQIKGLKPGLLINKPPTEEQLKGGIRVGTKGYDKEKEAREKAYIAVIDGEEQLYIPAVWIYRMMIKAGGIYRIPIGGRRTSASSLLAGGITIEPEKIPLGHHDYKIDERSAVIQRSRVWRVRPWLPEWQVTFYMIYDKKLFEDVLADLKKILEDGGIRVGIGDYRPEKKGPFGKFTVEEFEVEE